jgi:LacI family transcriptional regulator
LGIQLGTGRLECNLATSEQTGRLGVFLRDGKHVRKILALGIPTMVVGHRKEDFPGVASVVTDSEAAGHLAAEHLLVCGFNHFAFCGPSRIRWSAARRESFQRRLIQTGKECHFFNAPADGGKTFWRTEHLAMGRWLKSLPKPVGVMACNDDYARQLVEACKTARLHVPDLVGIIGVDRLDYAQAARLAESLGRKLPVAGDYSLAEVFAGNGADEISRPRIGFAA